MATKNICIVGGGISGLSTLHYLSKKYHNRSDITLTLFEANKEVGGVIKSVKNNDFMYETAANGFQSYRENILDLINELKLSQELIQSNSESSDRFVRYQNKLCKAPNNLTSFLAFKPLNVQSKLKILFKLFSSEQSSNERETVFNFAKRRLSSSAAEYLVDPLCTGIFAGDSTKLILKEAFPAIYEKDREFKSIIDLFANIKKKKKAQKTTNNQKKKRHIHYSFKNGMITLINKLYENHKKNIVLNAPIEAMKITDNKIALDINEKKIFADKVYLTAPTRVSSKLIQEIYPSVSKAMLNVTYAPLILAVLLLDKRQVGESFNGFGHLCPKLENSPLIGVVHESSIFKGRCHNDKVLLRCIVGGVRYPEMIDMEDKALLSFLKKELQMLYQVQVEPIDFVIKRWPHAIPQYDENYLTLKNAISQHMNRNSKIEIVGNYYRGVSVSDCIKNAEITANNSNL